MRYDKWFNVGVTGGIPSCQNVEGFRGERTSFWQVMSWDFVKVLRTSDKWCINVLGCIISSRRLCPCKSVIRQSSRVSGKSFQKLLQVFLCLWVLCWKVWRKCKTVKCFIKCRTKIIGTQWAIRICQLLL